jgi:hypothetical protein
MTSDAYRSYVVRIRRRRRGLTEGIVVRAEVEDLLDGIRARVEDDRAETLAADLEGFVDASRPPPPAPLLTDEQA